MGASPDEKPEAPPGVDNRGQPRRRVLLSGRMVHSPHEETVDCTIVDVSSTGARLRLPDGAFLAEPLFLIDLTHGLAFKARLAWRRDNKAGLEFIDYHDLSKPGDFPPRLAQMWRDHIRAG
jgi:hypothetical protein